MNEQSGNGAAPGLRVDTGGILMRHGAEQPGLPARQDDERPLSRPRIEIIREDEAGGVIARTYRYLGDAERADVEPEQLSDELLVHGPVRAGKSDDEIVRDICERARVDEATARLILRRARTPGLRRSLGEAFAVRELPRGDTDASAPA